MMELKNLLTKFKNKEETPEYFFALEIDSDHVKSAIWTVLANQTKIVKLGTTENWDGTSEEELLAAVDKSISIASENLSPEPTGVIFGTPESWIDKDNIIPDKKKLLKLICEQLELKPLGFVVTNIALIQYLKNEEGTPPSAIFLQLKLEEIGVILVRLGKIIGTHSVGRSEDLGTDVEEGLSRFKNIDHLPSRMILFNSEADFEEAKQQLISYDWQDKLPFIHFPKVEVLSADDSIKAVALAGGSEVAKALGFEIKQSKTTTAEDLGFINNQDVAAQVQPEVEPEAEPEISVETVFKTPSDPIVDESDTSLSSTVAINKSSFDVGNVIQKSIGLFKTKISQLKSLPLMSLFSKTHIGFSLVIGGLFLILIAVLISYWYLPKAQVTIFVEPKTIEEELKLIIDSQSDSLNADTGTLPGELLEISVSGEKDKPTTGSNLVGDSAMGEITIFNKTSNSKTFAIGTVLIGSDNLTFTLDEEITVASRSSQEDDEGVITITPGKSKAEITAKSIGPEGNYSSDSKLTFKQFSEEDFSAKTETGLSGGTAREVKAVSQQDQDELLEILTVDLKNKAAADLKQQLGEGLALIEVDAGQKVISKTFNHDVGEEADSLRLAVKLEYTGFSYSLSDLNLLLQQAVKEKIPDNFQISTASQTEIEPAVLISDSQAKIDVSFKSQLIPKLDFSEIKKNLTGRYPNVIQEYLATLPNFVRADIKITPNLPDKLKTLPRVTKNIIIDVQTQ